MTSRPAAVGFARLLSKSYLSGGAGFVGTFAWRWVLVGLREGWEGGGRGPALWGPLRGGGCGVGWGGGGGERGGGGGWWVCERVGGHLCLEVGLVGEGWQRWGTEEHCALCTGRRCHVAPPPCPPPNLAACTVNATSAIPQPYLCHHRLVRPPCAAPPKCSTASTAPRRATSSPSGWCSGR